MLLDSCIEHFQRLKLACADSIYSKGDFKTYIKIFTKMKLEIVEKLQGQIGFKVLPWRWIVERTFAWIGKFRRLSKDYEYLNLHSETMVYLAMINIMTRRLSKIS